MTMFTEDSTTTTNNQSFTNQRDFCTYLSVSYAQEEDAVFAINVLLAAVNMILCVCATVLNALVIIAIRKNSALHSPTNSLLCCLAFSDFLTGALVQSSFAAAKIAEIQRNIPVYCTAFAVADFVAWVAVGASIFFLTAISLERLISVRWPLRYEVLFTKETNYAIFASAWLLPILNQCLRCWVLSRETVTIVIFLSVFPCIAITTAAYCFVWKVLRRHQRQLTNQDRLRQRFHGEGKATEVMNKRRSVVTMLYVYALFLLSCIPTLYSLYVFKEFGFRFTARSSNLWGISSTVAFTNSSLNPLVYCWRMTKIRRAILNILKSAKQLFCYPATRVEIFHITNTVSTWRPA